VIGLEVERTTLEEVFARVTLVAAEGAAAA
jgi:hypothetical protein